MRLGWLLGCGRGGLCIYSCKDGTMLELCGPSGGRGGCRAAVATAVETVVDDGREG